MPIYNFTCENGHAHEVIRSYELRDTPWPCMTCESPMIRDAVSRPHVPGSGVYSYAPNVGNAEQFERRLEAQKAGQKVIPKVG